jgi:thiol:disulfide interchange protein
MLERTVFAAPEFKREAQRFVLFKVNTSDPPTEDLIKMVQKYDPTTGGQMPLPTVLFINSQGKELRALRAIGARSLEDFLGKMQEVS